MRILSLDWDSSYQRDLAAELEAAGHHIELFSRIAEALASDAARPFDLFISETRLPDKNGVQFLRELRQARGGRLPLVIFLTEADQPEVRELCLHEGAARFLLKKDGWPSIIAEIYGVISELEPPAPAPPGGPLGQARVFRGNLETIEMPDIVQLLNLGKKTGLLVLSGGEHEGRIFFDEGEVVAAVNGDERGMVAFTSLLSLNRGAFRFEVGPVQITRTIHQSTSSLMLDAVRMHDEGARRVHAGAPGQLQEEDGFDFEHLPAADLQESLGSSFEEELSIMEGLELGLAEEALAEEAAPSSSAFEVPEGPALAAPREVAPDAAPRPTPGAGQRAGSEPSRASSEPQPRTSSEPLAWTSALSPSPSPPAPSPPARPTSAFGTPAGGWPSEEVRGHSPAPGSATDRSAASDGAQELRRPARDSGRRERRPSRSTRRTAAIVAGLAAAVLASGYALFFSDLRPGRSANMEETDYRNLMLEVADNQAKVDSLEQIIRGVSTSVQSIGFTKAAAEQQIALLQDEIRETLEKRDAARQAAEETKRRDEEARPAAAEQRQAQAEGESGAAAPGQAPALPIALAPAEAGVSGTPSPALEAPSTARAGDDEVGRGEEALPSAAASDTAGAPPAADSPSAGTLEGALVGETPSPAEGGPDYSLGTLRSGPQFVPVDSRPTLRGTLRPQYPRRLADRKVGGAVTLWLLVNDAGAVIDVRVLRSSGLPELDKSAIDAIRRASYNPARRDDSAVPAWVQQQVVFKLD